MPNAIFRAYDIRGKYPSEINEEVVVEIVEKFFYGHSERSERSRDSSAAPQNNRKSLLKVVVGHDARISSPALYRAAIKGIKNKKTIIHNSKFIILPAGLITTPMMYFLVNDLKADYGIMVTASHNPKEYNGLKIVGKKAKPISGREVLKEIS